MKGRRVLILIASCVGAGLLAAFVTIVTMASTTSLGSTCNVPGDYDTIQEAINDLTCDPINVGAGTIYENVTVSRTVTIQGQGVSSTTVDGNGAGTVFVVQFGVVAALSDMTIVNGSAEQGGGIYNEGTLQVTSSILSGNEATPPEEEGGGGGIFNDGALIVITTIISGNSVSNYGWGGGGGGILNNGTLTVIMSTLMGNTVENERGGGGISNNGLLTLTNCLVTGNEAYDGAGIDNDGTAQLTNSTLSNNSANQGGGIYNRDELTVISSTLSNNSSIFRGAGILSGGAVTLTNSTLSGNKVTTDRPADANGGGGIFIYSGGRIYLTNSTLSGNSATEGGGILAFAEGTITITNSTLNGNTATYQGGGVFIRGVSVEVYVTNSIIANSTAGGDCSGAAIISHGHNIAGDNTCNLAAPGDWNNTDPLLGPLQDNGGPTLTHLPLPGSPAVAAGDIAVCPATDQRGYARLEEGGVGGMAYCDIGSVEIDLPPVVYLPIVLK